MSYFPVRERTTRSLFLCAQTVIGFVWVRFLFSHQSPVNSNQLLRNRLGRFLWFLKWVRLFKKGNRRFAQHADFLTQMSLRMQETQKYVFVSQDFGMPSA